jgi:enoyl-[acyl-carrier-protein] reductase (NADH)
MAKVIADGTRAEGMSVEAMRDSDLNTISLRRVAEAEGVANLALRLSCDLARNITGHVIGVDGNVEYL